MSEPTDLLCLPVTGEASELSGSWAEMTSFGDRMKDTPRPVATVKRSSVPAPVNLDALSLQEEEYHEGRNSDTTRKRGCSDAKMEQWLAGLGLTKGRDHILVVL